MYLPKPSEGNYTPPPVGTHVAVCYRVIDLGTQETVYKGETKLAHRIMLSWELSNELMEDGKPFTTSKTYTLSMHEKATLRKDLEAWRGLPFTDSDFGPGGFNLKKLLGAPCMIGINAVPSENGKTYHKVSNVLRLPKGMQKPELVNEFVYVCLEQGEFDEEAFGKLSDKIKEDISKSPQYAALQVSPAQDTAPFPDDDIPFA
jgi:hypothetical protein